MLGTFAIFNFISTCLFFFCVVFVTFKSSLLYGKWDRLYVGSNGRSMQERESVFSYCPKLGIRFFFFLQTKRRS
jgi:hypothetical protein